MCCARAALRQLRLGSALGQNARVIGALVLAFDPREQLIRRCVAHSVALAEAIGQSKKQRNDGRLVVRVRRADIEANAFRFARFIEEAITLRLFQGGRDGLARQ